MAASAKIAGVEPADTRVERENMMVRLKIAAKIWLSIGIFILGFIVFTILSQVMGMSMEGKLGTLAQALYPAALRSNEAEAAFEQAVKGFAEAVVVQERSSLDHGAEGVRRTVECLREVAGIQGLPAERQVEALRIAASAEQFLPAARGTYGTVLANPLNIPPELQRQMLDLAARTNSIRSALEALRDGFTQDLQSQLATLRTSSARLRWFGLWVFATTLFVATLLVNWTIRRAIAGPLMHAEAELAHERDLLRILFDNVPDCIYFKDAESRFLRINKAQSLLLGVRDEKAAEGRTDFDFFDREFAQQTYDEEREIMRTGRPVVSKLEHLTLSGNPHWLTATKVPVREEDGSICGLIGISRDITAWKEAVESVQKSEESFRLLFAAIPHAAWVYDLETLRFLEVNDSAVRCYGYSADEFRKLQVSGIHAPQEESRLRQALASADPAKVLSGAWKHQTKGGQTRDVEAGAQVFVFRDRHAVMEVVQDVTERNRLETELHQAQRLESVGQLAAGIAHEINTPIQYVGDNLRFIRESFETRTMVVAQYEQLRLAAEAGQVTTAQLEQLARAVQEADLDYLNQEIPKAAEQSLEGVERVATIVRAMKEFAHPGHKDKAAADLNKALGNALIVARNEFKYVADAETDFGELPPVVCHIAEMNQVFLNLLINAAHAIGEVVKGTQGRGKITVRTRYEGDQVVVAISDTGCGIPDAIRAKIFDPFFTTKPVGRGTGQGLAIARSIVVEKHGGTLTFEPNGNQGTTFLVSLPTGGAEVTAGRASTSERE
jgi:two-component system, NtrC family, sensor kinase